MIYLLFGLILFLGAHSLRIFADEWRARTIGRIGDGPWKGIYSLVSIAGFALLVWGYGQARLDGTTLYVPPVFVRHISGLLMLLSLILLAAAYVPANHIKAAVGHPMLVGVKVWAFAHLLSNGRVADLLLFGAFLVWAILDFRVSRRRDRAAGTVYPAGRASRTLLAVAAGSAAWAAFMFGLHLWLIGVSPM